jgi:hypothetical protein
VPIGPLLPGAAANHRLVHFRSARPSRKNRAAIIVSLAYIYEYKLNLGRLQGSYWTGGIAASILS